MATGGRSSMHYEVERAMRTIFKRCVQCPDTQPSCPSCKDSEICSLVPQDCNTCAHMTCIKDPSAAPSSPGPNVGAIAGGVIGGVVVVAIVVFFVWRFWIKKRREQQELEAEEWEDEEESTEQKEGQEARRFAAMHSDAESTRTRGSLANSILSRASNIIQIAYIPGVTNRNGSGHNSLHAPVPPVPAAQRQAPKSPLSNEGDALFFRPGDLRDSTWSATSSLRSGNRDTQYTRQSITPSLARSSMASDVYRDDATQMPMPAQTVTRAAPRMVSVKTSNSSPSETSGTKTPVDPTEHAQFAANTPEGKGKGIQVMMPGEGPSRSSTANSGRSGEGQYVRAKQVTVGGGKNTPSRENSSTSLTPSMASKQSKHTPAVSSPLAEIEDESEDESSASAHAAQGLARETGAGSTPPLIQPVESPFFDASEHPSGASAPPRVNPYASMGSSIDGTARRGGPRGMNVLSDIIEEATKRASRVPSHDGLGGKRDQSPFGDQHATH